MKRIIVITILALTVLVPSFGHKSGNFYYTIEGRGKDRTVTITMFVGKSDKVVIPKAINGIPVRRIGAKAFYYFERKLGIWGGDSKTKKITSVIIPDGVTTIGAEAFHDNELTSVTIPNSVTIIDVNAFAINELTSITIPNSVTIIDVNAFAINELTSITIPNRVAYLPGCNGNQLTSVTIPNSVTAIGDGAFKSNKLTSITIPDSVTTIGEGAFYGNKLTSITIPNSVAAIGKEAFVDSIEGFLVVYGPRTGKYEKRDNQWYYNGVRIVEPARIICEIGIHILSIDGKKTGNDLFEESRSPDVYLLPGVHSIEVTYHTLSGTWSVGSVTFEHKLFLESGVYKLTGDDDWIKEKIRFGIEKQ